MVFESLLKYTESKNVAFLPFFLLLLTFVIISWNLIKWYQRWKTLPPGPIGLPLVGYLPFLGSEPYKKLWEMKKKYGDIIGIYFGTKYTVIVNEYSLGKKAISHSSALYRPTDIFTHIHSLGFGRSNGEEWIEQRRFSLSVSRDLGLGRSSWEALMMDEVQGFLDEIQKSGGNAVDVSEALEYSVTSNIMSLLIGRRLDKEQDANKVRLCLEFNDRALEDLGIFQSVAAMPYLGKLLEYFKLVGYSRIIEISRKFRKFIMEEIEEHKRAEEQQDFISSYLNKLKTLEKSKSDAQHFFSEDMLEGNVTVLFLGASDTTRSSLGWLFRLMAEYKSIQDKVCKEIIDAVGKEGAVKYEERHQIPYTFAVLMEAQRCSSIVPLSTARVAQEDIPLGDYIIPKGAQIMVNLWGLHHDPKYWSEPDKFIPERFLTDGGTKLIKQPPSFAPFSMGKRMCPGETVAWMEILAYFTHVVRKYEISFPEGVKPEYKSLRGLVERLAPQPLCFKERK